MLGGQNQNSLEVAFDNLETQLLRSLSRFRVIDLAAGKFEDPLITGLWQALTQLRGEQTLENLNTVEAKVSACKKERKTLPYKDIEQAISTFKSTLADQTDGNRPARNRP